VPTPPGAPGYGGYGYPYPYPYPAPPPRKPSNGIALAGAITSFIPLLGLTLSIIGRVRASALGGVGKVAGTIGIVLGLLFTGGFCVGAYFLTTSTFADPGCISSDGVRVEINATFADDWQAVTNAQQDQDPAALNAAVSTFADDAARAQEQLQVAVGQARHANVAAALTDLENDMAMFATQAREQPQDPDIDALIQTSDSITADDKALDRLCLGISG
jgi:hypothetical protein